jgi:hypothetical protein
VRNCFLIHVVLFGALLTSGCGNSDSKSALPSAPSAVTAPAMVPRTGAAVTGMIQSAAAASGIGTTLFTPQTVTASGSSVSGQIDTAGRFTLSGIPPGQVELRFDGPGGSASLPVGLLTDGQHVAITVTLNGTTATLAGREHAVELHGALTGLTGTCPTVSFTVMGTVVKTTAATRFEGVPCGTLAAGTMVEVEGTPQPDGSVVAMKVAAEVREVELHGALTGLSGTCPTVSFTVMGTVVKTSAATRFEGATCGTLVTGTTVEVEGTLQADGSVLAMKVAAEVREVELRGALTGLTGTCPTVSFTVMATVVKTSAATRFAGLTCGTLTNGTTVEVGGTQQPDGSVLALKVGREDDARPNPAER